MSMVKSTILALVWPLSIASADQMFWVERGQNRILRADLDGSNIQTVVENVPTERGLAVDPIRQSVFFGSRTTNALGTIRTVKFDGSGLRMIAEPGIYEFDYFDVDRSTGKVYFDRNDFSGFGGIVGRVNPDGSSFESLITFERGFTFGIAVAPSRDEMYFHHAGELFRSTLNGQNLTSILPGTNNVTDIAIDIIHEHVFWVTVFGNGIWRANLDGTGTILLVPPSGSDLMQGIAVDSLGGKLYWTNQTQGAIYRANTNGTEVEVLVSGLDLPMGIDLTVPDSELITAKLDIKPGSCPNPVNVRSRGVVPMAIVGTSTFDVTQIDRSTLLLARTDGIGGSIAPLSGPPGPGFVVEDAATPFEGELCDCHTLTGDGIDDLSLKFSTEDMVAALELGTMPTRTELRLRVSGLLLDQTPFEGDDCVLLLTPNPGRGGSPLDADVDADMSSAESPEEQEETAPSATRLDAEEETEELFTEPMAGCGILSPALVLMTLGGLFLSRLGRGAAKRRH